MQKDKRNLTVAQEHLRSAYEEVTQAQGQAERSMAEAAVGRALSHLDLVSRRLEQERAQVGRNETARAVERAFAASRLAWQGVHNTLNDWPRSVPQALDPVQQNLLEAINAVDAALDTATTEEALRP
jgi:hypothetical protein